MRFYYWPSCPRCGFIVIGVYGSGNHGHDASCRNRMDERMKHQDYLDLDFKDSMELTPLDSRRDFFKQLGGGIIILMALGDLAEAQEAGRKRGGRPGGGAPSDFNAYLRIGEDGRVTCFTGKIEMGQGPITSFPQMLAEE